MATPYFDYEGAHDRELERRVDAEKRELFFRLFYRERVGRLAGWLLSVSEAKKVARKKRKKIVTSPYHWSTEQVGEFLRKFVHRAEDETFCNDICKDMYFCDLKKGHKGKHSEGPGLLSW